MVNDRAKPIVIAALLTVSLGVLAGRFGVQLNSARKTIPIATSQPVTSWSPRPMSATGAELERFFLVLKTEDTGQPVFNCPSSAAVPETLPASELIELDPQ